MIRVLVLSDLSAVHTPRFVEALQRRGLEVGCLSLEPFDPVAYPYGIYVKPRIPFPLRARYISSVDRVKRAVAHFHPDVLVPIHLPNYGLLAWLIHPGVPVYLVAWGSDLLYTAEKTPFHRWVTRRILQAATAWNVDALEMERILIQKYRIPPSRVDRITWGLSMEWLETTGVPEQPERWDIFSHRRLDPDMDPLTLIHAFHEARRQGYPGRLILAGDGKLRAQVLQTVARLQLQTAVEWIGWQSASTLRARMREAGIYLASPRVDSTSVSLLEAMSQGLFPVVTDLPANREWVLHEWTGYLFPSGHPRAAARGLLWAWKNPDRVQDARQHNRRMVQTLARWDAHMDRVAERLDALVREVRT